jgi:hypothetical protein
LSLICFSGVIAYGSLKVNEFVVGNEPTTNFNPVAHNMTELGILETEEINFGMGLFMYKEVSGEYVAAHDIDKRYLQFELVNQNWDFTDGMRRS